MRHRNYPDPAGADLARSLILAEGGAPHISAEAVGDSPGRLLVEQYEFGGDAAALDRGIKVLRSAPPSPWLAHALLLRHQRTGHR